MMLATELWHLIFEHMNLSDMFELMRVSRQLNSAVHSYKRHLFIDDVKPLLNRNWTIFACQWLSCQREINLSNIDIPSHEIVRIIDQFRSIHTVIVTNIVNETKFIELLCIYANVDTTYQNRHICIVLGDNNGTKQLRHNRIKDFYNAIPNGKLCRKLVKKTKNSKTTI